jgi:hypothetical protein
MWYTIAPRYDDARKTPLKKRHMVMAQWCNCIFDSFHEEKYNYIWSMGKILIQVSYQSLNPKNSFSVLFAPLHSNLLLELEISWR